MCPPPPSALSRLRPTQRLPWSPGRGVLLAGWLLFLALAGYQLGLPGLHYDEAREAGVNAMEILTGAPVTAFRDATVTLFGRDWPLMVQDYIGALNVYLALPFLALTGIGVPNLRALPVLLALLALFMLERALAEWTARVDGTPRPSRLPFPSRAGVLATVLLAAAPTFVFWSRQGIFVTNATLPTSYATLWLGLRWLRTAAPRDLFLALAATGLALYAKLLALWVVGPFWLMVAVWWVLGSRSSAREPMVGAGERWPRPTLTPRLLAGGAVALLLPLLPLLLFNLQTQGTLRQVLGNLERSYYGVENADVLGNLSVRLAQVIQVIRGDHLWYLGGVHGNPLAPWAAGLVVGLALVTPGGRRRLGAPLLLVALAVGASLFTVSDLFITHYALLHPLLVALVALGLDALGTSFPGLGVRARPRALALGALVAAWLVLDVSASLAYHRDLGRSGGLVDHSDASYHLAYYLRYNGLGAPIALDWGMDAPVRYLSQGTVTPIEIFGYGSLEAPDPGFALRLGPFLSNPDNVYLLRAPGNQVFRGRREAFFDQVQLRGYRAERLQEFSQRDGTPLYELWRVVP